VNIQTGKTISEHNRESKSVPPRFEAATIILDFEEREALYRRIDRRVDEMLAAGLEEEVRTLLEKGIVPEKYTSMQAIGYKEVVPYLRGEYSRDDAAYQIKLRTRHFAKRQLTWHKREPDVIYIDRRRFDGNTEDMCGFMSDECRKRGII
jgi:tRNA dimethylallyltransferase